MSETDEPQGFEHTHNILNINQNSQSLMTFIISKLKSKLKQHIIIARGNKRIDCEYTYAMAIAILIRHTMSFDNAHFFAQLRHPVL